MQFDLTSKTTLAMIVTASCGLLAIVGVQVDETQKSSLVEGVSLLVQAVTVIGPIVGAILHQRAKKKAQIALVNAGVSHEEAKAATKS